APVLGIGPQLLDVGRRRRLARPRGQRRGGHEGGRPPRGTGDPTVTAPTTVGPAPSAPWGLPERPRDEAVCPAVCPRESISVTRHPTPSHTRWRNAARIMSSSKDLRQTPGLSRRRPRVRVPSTPPTKSH